MAEFKTAEQYVVEKVEMLERELDSAKVEHSMAISQYEMAVDELKKELNSAYELLNMLRDFIEVRTNSYFRNTVCVENIYEKEHPELVARIMEYYDIRPDEEGDNE